MQSVFEKYADMEISEEETEVLLSNVVDEDGEVYPAYQVGWEIGSVIAAHYQVGVVSSKIRANSDTGGHTGNLVPVFAAGTGSEKFNGVMDNTEIVELIAEADKPFHGPPPGKENGHGKGNGKGKGQ
ncbi:alkaline phosphatase [Alteribacillus sp. HJP-4]|uniref:alkaline phosphatase n=1 Tax=Alteribacillus sp. HJP-4 TaxID=2775394 RepID=UPI0035CCEAEC